MNLKEFIKDAKLDWELQEDWNKAKPNTEWDWIESYFIDLHYKIISEKNRQIGKWEKQIKLYPPRIRGYCQDILEDLRETL